MILVEVVRVLIYDFDLDLDFDFDSGLMVSSVLGVHLVTIAIATGIPTLPPILTTIPTAHPLPTTYTPRRARYLQGPRTSQYHPTTLLDLLERICEAASPADLGTCDEARESLGRRVGSSRRSWTCVGGG